MRNVWKACFGLLCLAGLAPAAPAQVQVLYTNPGTGTLRTGDGFTLGTSFTVGPTSEVVSALGVWVSTNNGTTLAAGIPVGIWDGTTNVMIASATVPAGTGRTVGEFGYTSLALPVTLLAGQGYILGAYYAPTDTTDLLHDKSATPTTDPAFSGFVARFTGSNTVGAISEPLGGAGFGAYVGPSFEFSPVPEPSSLALVGGAALAGVRLAVRRRTSYAASGAVAG